MKSEHNSEDGTFRIVLENAASQFARIGIESSQLDARLLLEEASGLNHAQLISRLNEKPELQAAKTFSDMVTRRIAGEPVHRILGYREFFGRRFNLNSSTLEPRPETEILVEEVLGDYAGKSENLKVLDMGTGSGAIAVTLAAELQDSTITASDIDSDALTQAERNAELHEVAGRMHFRRSDMYGNISGIYEIIVSNPPYIPRNQLSNLQKEVRLHDPSRALDGGVDGLDFYRVLLRGAKEFLTCNGAIFLEIGIGQEEEIKSLAKNCNLVFEKSVPDLSGIIRVLKFSS